jgi:hypothetical protein
MLPSLRRTLVPQRSLLQRSLTRNLCAPAVPLVDEVRSDLDMMKAKVAEKVDVGYSPDAFKAALAAGTVDTGLLSQTMDFSDDARKMVMKLNMSAASMAKEMATPMVADFSAMEAKLDSSIVAEVAAIYSSELEAAMKVNDSSTEIAAMEKEISAMFTGSGGLLELASKEEKASEAGMLQCIADMEKLEVDVQDVSNVTIGEILDREPELRAEIEEEIKNNVWAP